MIGWSLLRAFVMGGKTLDKRKRAATPFNTSAGEFFCRRAVQPVDKLLTPTVRQRRIPKLVQSGRSIFYPTGQLFTLPAKYLFCHASYGWRRGSKYVRTGLALCSDKLPGRPAFPIRRHVFWSATRWSTKFPGRPEFCQREP